MHSAEQEHEGRHHEAGQSQIEMIEQEGLLEHARQLGEVFRARLEAIREQCDIVREVRVLGVMIGLELTIASLFESPRLKDFSLLLLSEMLRQNDATAPEAIAARRGGRAR